MAAKERLQRFFGERREVLMAVSLGPNDYAFCVSTTGRNRYFATIIHESAIRDINRAAGNYHEEEFSDLQTAAITADGWYRKAATEGMEL